VRARAACYCACGPKGDSSRIDYGGSSFQSKSQQRRRATPDAVPVVRTLPLGVERQVRKRRVAAVHRMRMQRPVGHEGVGKRQQQVGELVVEKWRRHPADVEKGVRGERNLSTHSREKEKACDGIGRARVSSDLERGAFVVALVFSLIGDVFANW
jgi:hypothetical protein